MDLLSHVPGVNVTGSFTPGANTPAPFNVAHVGGVDGTGPQNATKNMAEIYNRLLLERAAVILKAGLAIDNENWVQMAEAIEKLIDDNSFNVDELIAYQQTYGLAEVVVTNVSWADGVSRTAGTNLLGTVTTRVFTNTATVPRKLLVQYVGTAACHNCQSASIGVLGYAERSVNGGAYALFTNSQYAVMQCNTGGFQNENGAGSGLASEVFTIAPGATLTLATRQRLNFYITSQGPNTGIDVAYERGSWSYTFI